MKFSLHHSCYNRLFHSFFLWAMVSQWDLSLGIVSLRTTLFLCQILLCCFSRPQRVPQSWKDKWLDNLLKIKNIAQYVNRTYIVPSLTSSLITLFLSLCATRNAEGHPVTMWIVAVHLWVQLCSQYPLCMTDILSAKCPASCYVPPDLFFSRDLIAKIFSKLLMLSLSLFKPHGYTIRLTMQCGVLIVIWRL